MSEVLTNQHGDVLLFKLDCRGSNFDSFTKAKPQNGRYILAEGEATGHAHVITDINNCDLYADEDGNLFVEVRSPVDLTHEEHKTQTIEPGLYRVGRVREVDPFSEEIREVTD